MPGPPCSKSSRDLRNQCQGILKMFRQDLICHLSVKYSQAKMVYKLAHSFLLCLYPATRGFVMVYSNIITYLSQHIFKRKKTQAPLYTVQGHWGSDGKKNVLFYMLCNKSWSPYKVRAFFFLRGRGWEQCTFVFHYSTFTPHEKSFYSLKSIIKLFFIYWYCLLLYCFHCVSIVSANFKAITAFNKLVRYYVILQSTASKCDWLKHESEATQKVLCGNERKVQL